MSGRPLESRLAALRRRLRMALLAAGVGRLMAAASALVLATFVLDRALRLTPSVRAAQLGLAACLLAWLAVRRLATAATRSLPDHALALELEDRLPALGDALGSAAWFATGSGGGGSAVLRAAVIERANASVPALEPGALIDWRPARRWLVTGGAGALVVVLLAAADTHAAGIWFQRNVLLSDRDWPRRTRLTMPGFREGLLYAARGSDVTVRVQVSGLVPDRARLRVRGLGDRRTQTLPMARGAGGEFLADLPGLTDPVELSVRAGDGRLTGHRIVVVDRPQVASARLVVRPPAYVSSEPVEVPIRSTASRVPRGSDVEVIIQATKPLSAAEWQQGGRAGQQMAPAGPNSASCTLSVHEDTRCSFKLTDTFGVASGAPFVAEIEAVPDRAPELALEASGVGTMLVPSARVPLSIRVHDDYGTQEAWLECSHHGADGPAGLPAVALFEGTARPDVRVRHALDLTEFDLATGGRLVLRGGARDGCTLGGPNTGYSAELSFRLVSAQDLLRALGVEQRDLRRDLEDQIRRQRQTAEELRSATPPAAEALSNAQRSAGRVLVGIADGCASVLDQLLNNGLIDAPSRDARAGSIVLPLRDVAAESGTLRRSADVLARGGPEAAGAAADLVDEAVAVMEDVRARMMLLEDYAALLATVREIRREQEDLLGRTHDLRNQGIDALLGVP